jgi:acetylornithine/succinyldiaminopimelate/putrescine aminotransferase
MTNQNEDRTVNTEEYNKRLMNNVVRMPMVIGPCQDASMGEVVEDAIMGKVHAELLDFWGDEGVCSLGYNTPEVIQAVLKFFGSGHPHQLPDIYPNQRRWDAAEIICDRTGMDRIFFANSGTEANEAAIKIARKHWFDQGREDRMQILTVEGNFHGRTGLSLAAGDYRVSPYHRVGFGPIAEGFGVIEEAVHKKGEDGPPFLQVVKNGSECPSFEPDWDHTAAIILAPVLGNNLVKTYSKTFWQELERIRAEHGVLLIYDDVQAGSGRAGYFATWQHPDIQVKPDVMTLAKGIAMGFPMSCMLASEELTKAFTPGVHFNTFGGSPFVCHMAVELYRWLDDNIEHVRDRGEMIRASFTEMDWVIEHDGSGMLNAFTPDFHKFGYDGFQFIHEARQLGLSLATHRKYGPIRFTPPLNTPKGVIQHALGILEVTHKTLATK